MNVWLLIFIFVILAACAYVTVQLCVRARARNRTRPSKEAETFLLRTNDLIEEAQQARDIRVIALPIIEAVQDHIEIARDNHDMFLNLRIDGFADVIRDNFNLDIPEIRIPPDLDAYVATNELRQPRPTETKQDVISHAFKASITHTSDPQNVHDSAVQRDIKAITDKLLINRAHNSVPDEILNFILVSDIEPHKKECAVDAYDTIKNNGVRISSVDCTEQQLLDAVWRRAHDPINAANQENLRLSIVDALASCIEKGKPVCSTGRSTRIISSLCLLDADESISRVGTSEMYKNEILNRANKLLTNVIESAQKSDDTELKRLGDSFKDTNIDSASISESAKHKMNQMYEEGLRTIQSDYKEHWSPKLQSELKCVLSSML